jgi:hypothetical protein
MFHLYLQPGISNHADEGAANERPHMGRLAAAASARWE